MANTVEDVKKYVTDQTTQAAIDALEKQVEKTRQAYLNMDRNAEIAAQQGRANIQNQMQTAGVKQPVSATAGVIMNAAVGDVRNQNAQHRELNEQKMQNNIRYLQNASLEREEKLRRQAAQQKAENLAKYGDFSGYGELGYSPEQIQGMKSAYDAENNKPEEYTGLGKYAQTLLQLYEDNAGFDVESNLLEALQNGLISQQDYQAALIAARGIVPGKNTKTAKPEDVQPPVNPLQAAAQEAIGRVTDMENGKGIVTTQEDWNVLRDYYQSAGENVNNYLVFRGDRITVPGYGKISYEQAEQLEKQGKIVMTGADANGDPIYTVPYNKNNAGREQMIY